MILDNRTFQGQMEQSWAIVPFAEEKARSESAESVVKMRRSIEQTEWNDARQQQKVAKKESESDLIRSMEKILKYNVYIYI